MKHTTRVEIVFACSSFNIRLILVFSSYKMLWVSVKCVCYVPRNFCINKSNSITNKMQLIQIHKLFI